MIYIHIPFCRSFCIYCDFYSEIPHCRDRENEYFEAFAEAVSLELMQRKGEFSAESPNTLYIGGGTPSVLPPSALSTIIDAIKANGINTSFEEFTVEVNPDDIIHGGEYIKSLSDLGVNRISMGVQSFDDRILRWMNRRHDAETAKKAYSMLREQGVGNISVDLMFGISGLSDETWEKTLEQALSMPGGLPEHISAYQLSIEPGSRLNEMVSEGKYLDAPDEQCRHQYAMLCDALHRAGYEHYEISNFALPGKRAIHNSAYWSGSSYLGLGPGAHSYDACRKVRTWNRASLADYLAAGDFSGLRESETLAPEQSDIEKVMLSLRTSDGISAAELERIAGKAQVHEMLRLGNLEAAVNAADSAKTKSPETAEPRLRIPESRFFISDSIIAACLPG